MGKYGITFFYINMTSLWASGLRETSTAPLTLSFQGAPPAIIPTSATLSATNGQIMLLINGTTLNWVSGNALSLFTQDGAIPPDMCPTTNEHIDDLSVIVDNVITRGSALIYTNGKLEIFADLATGGFGITATTNGLNGNCSFNWKKNQ